MPVQTTDFKYVRVGEFGYTKQTNKVPVGDVDFPGIVTKLRRATLIRSHIKKTLLFVKERDATDDRAIVLVDVVAGIGGTTEWTGTSKTSYDCPLRGEVIDLPECLLCGARLPSYFDSFLPEGSSRNIHPDRGTIVEWSGFASAPGIILVTDVEAHMKDGARHRSGRYRSGILVMDPMAKFRVARTGTLDVRSRRELFILYDGSDVVIGHDVG